MRYPVIFTGFEQSPPIDLELDYRDKKIKEMREAGASLRLISQAVGLSEGGVYHSIKRLCLPLKPTNPRKTDVDKEVATRRAKGESLKEIAESLSVDPKTIGKRAAKLKIPDPYKGVKRPRRRSLSDHTATWETEHKSGMTISDIAAKHGVSYQSVWSALRRRALKSQKVD